MSPVCPGCPVAKAFLDGEVHAMEKAAVKGGRVLHIEITASPLKDGAGNIVAGIEVVREITGRRPAAR